MQVYGDSLKKFLADDISNINLDFFCCIPGTRIATLVDHLPPDPDVVTDLVIFVSIE